jgi:hypothetical protein
MAPHTLNSLGEGQAVIIERVSNLTKEQDEKHKQNRKDIHNLYNELQTICDEVWKLKIKMAIYSTVAGIVTTVIVKLVDLGLKHLT